MEITKMTVKDLDFISDNLEQDFNDFWNYNIFKSELENPHSKYIVAKKSTEIVGFAGIWIAIDVAHITNIVVKNNLRKSGIGSLLLQKLIDMCHELNLTEITLEVNEHNLPAIKLYEKFGFKHVGTRKKYYNRTDDALLFTIKLDKN